MKQSEKTKLGVETVEISRKKAKQLWGVTSDCWRTEEFILVYSSSTSSYQKIFFLFFTIKLWIIDFVIYKQISKEYLISFVLIVSSYQLRLKKSFPSLSSCYLKNVYFSDYSDRCPSIVARRYGALIAVLKPGLFLITLTYKIYLKYPII